MEDAFNKRKVCHLLRTFEKKELRDFEQFLGYKGKSSILKLWQRLRKTHPDFNISDQTLQKAISPNKKIKDNVYRVWVAELYTLAKEYVAIQQFKEDEHLYHNTLALALLWRKDETTYLKLQREQEKLFGETPKSTEFFHYEYQMEDLNYQYTTIMHHRSVTESLQKAADCLDQSLLVSKLKYIVVMRNRERITGEQYDYNLQEEILAYLCKKPHKEEALIHLYHLLVQIHQNLSDKLLFHEFSDYFEQHLPQIEQSEARQLLTFASNLAHWNIQLGNLYYLSLLFDLIKILVQEKLAIIKGAYHSYHFRNIIRAAILVNEVDWAERFLEENIGKVAEKEADNLYTFNRAFLHFAKGEYALQAPYLHKMQTNDYHFEDPHTNILFRLLNIKTAFQLLALNPKEMQVRTYDSHMNAFRLFIPKLLKVSNQHAQACANFYKALQGIFLKKYGKRRKDFTREDVLGLQPIVELPWLLGQV